MGMLPLALPEMLGTHAIWGNFGPRGRLYHQNPQNVVSGFDSFGGVHTIKTWWTVTVELLGWDFWIHM